MTLREPAFKLRHAPLTRHAAAAGITKLLFGKPNQAANIKSIAKAFREEFPVETLDANGHADMYSAGYGLR